jgi:TPR repeat protein
MQELPRNMRLTAFNPHRSSFSCTHEASKVPPIDSQAQAWFEEGMALSSYGVYYEDRDIPKAAALWQKAAERKHWKAMLNLASIYARGDGEGPFHVKRDTERAVLLTEDAMRLGIPAAFDLMGTLHAEGRGVKASVDRAWAFWQLAADMGNPDSMAHIGSVSAASYDDTRRGRWANRKIALQMLECGMAQGNGKAAYELGVALNGNDPELDEDYTKALQALHAAVKFGHQPAAGSLFVAFDNGKPLVDHRVDKARAQRYRALNKALLRNPDLRFPNLDRILPLPPAELPRWDGDTKSLVQSAIGVRPAPAYPALPAHSARDRTFIPAGHHIVPLKYSPQTKPFRGYHGVFANDNKGTLYIERALYDGYYQVRSVYSFKLDPYKNGQLEAIRQKEVEGLPPLFYKAGEALHLYGATAKTLAFTTEEDHLEVVWQFLGQAQPLPPLVDWLARAGTVRSIRAMPPAPSSASRCNNGETCPTSGVWQPYVRDDQHALFHTLPRCAPLSDTTRFTDAWRLQSFVVAGESVPLLSMPGLAREAVAWQLIEAGERGFLA